MLQESMIIVVSVILVAFFLWFLVPISYILYNNVVTVFNPIVPSQDRQTWETVHSMTYNLVKFLGFIIIAATAYWIWVIAQRKRAEDIVS